MVTGTNTSATNPMLLQLREFYEYLKSYKVILLVSVILCLLAVVIYRLFDQPVYRVNSILHVEGFGKDKLQGKAENKNLNLRSAGILQKAIEESPLMVTYEVADGSKVKEINRNASPVYVRVQHIEPGFYKREISIRMVDDRSFEIAAKGFDKSYTFNTAIHLPEADFTVIRNAGSKYAGEEIHVRFNNPNELTSAYAKKLNINADSENKNTLVLSVTDSHPQKGIDFLNTLNKVYASLTPANTDKRKQIISIEDSIRVLQQEMAVLNKKKQEQVTITKTKPVKQAAIKNKVSDIQKQTFKVLQAYLNKPMDNFVQLPASYATRDSYLDRQINLYNDLQLQKQKDTGDRSIVQNITKIKADIESRIDSYFKPVMQKPAQPETYVTTTLPVKESGRTRAMRQLKQSRLNELASERKSIIKNTDSSKISVLEKPTYTRVPFVFEATLLYLGAVLIGLVLPIPLIYAKNTLTKNVLSVNDIQSKVNIPVIGYFSHHGKETDKVEAVADLGRYKYELSVIAAELEKLNGKKTGTGQVIAVSSYVSGEGKSYFANHLAVFLKGTEKKAVFVDMNLINYSENDHAGIANYISDAGITEEDILMGSPKHTNLFFIGSGTSEKQKVAEDLPFYQWEVGKTEHKRMESPKLKTLITSLKKKFDYVILDTPSYNQEPSVTAVYPLADIHLHMVRYNYTKKTALQTMLAEGRDQENRQKMYIVFNDIKHTSPQFYKTLNNTYQA